MENIEYWVDQVYAAGGDRQQLNRLYDEWAAEYEQHKWATGNPVIAISAGLIGRHVDDFGARILDAGCGAGNLGQVLHQIGYDNLEALDPSAGMLEVARRKSIYRALHELFLEPGIDLPGKTYDLVAASGDFGAEAETFVADRPAALSPPQQTGTPRPVQSARLSSAQRRPAPSFDRLKIQRPTSLGVPGERLLFLLLALCAALLWWSLSN